MATAEDVEKGLVLHPQLKGRLTLYTRGTHGKAERFIQTAFGEWAHAKAYDTSDQRAQISRSGSAATIGAGPTPA
jgi:hypothetical protein